VIYSEWVERGGRTRKLHLCRLFNLQVAVQTEKHAIIVLAESEFPTLIALHGERSGLGYAG
ncbi:MAG TPA: hypothetical protein VGQ08_09495, partial [Nitrospiraceae bacterium]|nr:hypothetical protein [Nitrospiraceae bacterium]